MKKENLKKFLILLQEKERSNIPITEKEILDSTEWSQTTFRTYLGKGQLSDFLLKKGNDFISFNTSSIIEEEFKKLLTQSKSRRSLGHQCKSILAKSLLKKSRDNMILAIEIYNRPSLNNRLDGFVLCFCVAWEQLLKAILIEKDGEETIFVKNNNSKGYRQSISLKKCLERRYKQDDVIRKNIEKIAFLRNQAAHLLIPETQSVLSRVFQSGIFNYSVVFLEFADIPFLNTPNSGMISLVGDPSSPKITVLKSKYGEILGEEIFNMLNLTIQETKNIDSLKFAIPFGIELAFVGKDFKGNVIKLSRMDEGHEGLNNAIVINKFSDPSQKYKYTQNEVIKLINKKLKEEYDIEFLEERLIAKDKDKNNKDFPVINSYCFQSIIIKLKWNGINNEYHYKTEKFSHHLYSDKAIEKIIEKIVNDKNFVKKARESLSRNRRKNREAKK